MTKRGEVLASDERRKRTVAMRVALWSFGLLLFSTGFRGLGKRNLLAIQTRQETWSLPNLPEAFSGLRVLHISDLHIDLCPEVVDRVIEGATGLDYDLTVMTGDYQDGVGRADLHKAQGGLLRIREALDGDIYFVLGNHDDHSMLEWGEKEGFTGLHDCGVELNKDGSRIFIGGLKYVSGYQRADSLPAKPAGSMFSLLLSHSPQKAKVAARRGFDFFLSGHTHGGQICLPNGRHIWAACNIPRALCAGRWRLGGMHGYTSRGVGGSGLPVRFNCPSEIVVHRLFPHGSGKSSTQTSSSCGILRA